MNILYWKPGRYIPADTHGDVAAFAQRQKERMALANVEFVKLERRKVVAIKKVSK
jgi:hypothetical protein